MQRSETAHASLRNYSSKAEGRCAHRRGPSGLERAAGGHRPAEHPRGNHPRTRSPDAMLHLQGAGHCHQPGQNGHGRRPGQPLPGGGAAHRLRRVPRHRDQRGPVLPGLYRPPVRRGLPQGRHHHRKPPLCHRPFQVHPVRQVRGRLPLRRHYQKYAPL